MWQQRHDPVAPGRHPALTLATEAHTEIHKWIFWGLHQKRGLGGLICRGSGGLAVLPLEGNQSRSPSSGRPDFPPLPFHPPSGCLQPFCVPCLEASSSSAGCPLGSLLAACLPPASLLLVFPPTEILAGFLQAPCHPPGPFAAFSAVPSL